MGYFQMGADPALFDVTALGTQVAQAAVRLEREVPRQAVFASTHVKRLWAGLVQIYGAAGEALIQTKYLEPEGWVSRSFYDLIRQASADQMRAAYRGLEIYWNSTMARYRNAIVRSSGEFVLFPDDGFGAAAASFLEAVQVVLQLVAKNQNVILNLFKHDLFTAAMLKMRSGTLAVLETIKYLTLELPVDAYNKAKQALSFANNLVTYAFWGGAAYLAYTLFKKARA